MKIIVIGLDGAELSLVKSFAERGLMPTARHLMERGATGRLKSATIPNSLAAWTTCATGVDESKHGIFLHLLKVEGMPRFRLASSCDRKALAIWEILGRYGYNSLVINVPLTYPPAAMIGKMITGMLTPSLQTAWSYPPDLKESILERIPTYRIDANRSLSRPRLLEEYLSCIDDRMEAVTYLMRSNSWDLLMVNFSTLDRAQHEFWAAIDPDHPMHGKMKKYEDVIPNVCRRLDGVVQRLIDEAGADTVVFVMSDHGAGPDSNAVLVNTWLEKQGLLYSKGSLSSLARSAAEEVVTMSSGRFAPLAKRLSATLHRSAHLGRKSASRISYDSHIPYSLEVGLDWSVTKAYFAPDRGGVWINLEGREEFGVVHETEYEELRNEVREVLLGWRLRETDEVVFAEVLNREQVFSGRYVHLVPDLIPIPSRDSISAICRINRRRTSMIPTWCAGTHTSHGILVAAGPGVREGIEVDSGRLHDLTPTILYCFGLPLTEEMDGKVLTDIFTEGFNSTRSIVREGTSYTESKKDSTLSKEEANMVEKRLADLGYVT